MWIKRVFLATRLMVLIPLAALLAVGCSTTEQARSVKESGFLGNYSELKKASKGDFLHVYWKPGVNLSQYKKLIITPVTIWKKADSDLKDVPSEELQHLANAFHTALKESMSMDFVVVDESGPDTIQLRSAITQADDSNVPLDVISTIIPQLHLLSSLKGLATGTDAFVGSASIEAEILDSTSGTRLFAMMDRRAGEQHFHGMTEKWDDVYEAFKVWANTLRADLEQHGAMP